MDNKEFDELSNTFVSEPNTGDLKPDNQCGGSEVSQCDICGKVTSVARKYYHYPILCDCHGPTHAEMVRYCKDCTPIEPKSTMICTHKEDGSQWNILVPTNIFIKTKDNV